MIEPKQNLLKVCWERSEETISEIFERQADLRKQLVEEWLKDILEQTEKVDK